MGALVHDEHMRELPAWVAWRHTRVGGRKVKMPYVAAKTPWRAGEPGLSLERAQRLKGEQNLDGIGLILSRETGVVGIDLDWKDLGTAPGELPEAARKLIERFDSYAEWSPSGMGAHILIRGRLPADSRHRTRWRGIDIEVYDDKRYFTVTDRVILDRPLAKRQEVLEGMYRAWLKPQPAPAPPPAAGGFDEGDEALLERAFRARNGRELRVLWEGGRLPRHASESEADLALAGMLAFWTGPDLERLVRLMYRSHRRRPKWEERRGETTYLRRTCQVAIQTQPRFWRGSDQTRRKSA